MPFTIFICILPLVIAVAATAKQFYNIRTTLRAIVSGCYLLATVVTSVATALFARASQIDVIWAKAMIQLAIGFVLTSEVRFSAQLPTTQADTSQAVFIFVVLKPWALRRYRVLLFATVAVHLILSILPPILLMTAGKSSQSTRTASYIMALVLSLAISVWITWSYGQQASSSLKLDSQYILLAILAVLSCAQASVTIIIPVYFDFRANEFISTESLIVRVEVYFTSITY
jgi:hypothetical protein